MFILFVIYFCIFFVLFRSVNLFRQQFLMPLQWAMESVRVQYVYLVYLHIIWRSVFWAILYLHVSIFGSDLLFFCYFSYWICLSYLGGFVWSLFEGFTPHFFNTLSWLCMRLYFYAVHWAKRKKESNAHAHMTKSLFFLRQLKVCAYNPDLGSVKQRNSSVFSCIIVRLFPLSSKRITFISSNQEKNEARNRY